MLYKTFIKKMEERGYIQEHSDYYIDGLCFIVLNIDNHNVLIARSMYMEDGQGYDFLYFTPTDFFKLLDAGKLIEYDLENRTFDSEEESNDRNR